MTTEKLILRIARFDPHRCCRKRHLVAHTTGLGRTCVLMMTIMLTLRTQAAEPPPPTEHPLLPGIRAAELHDTNWPRILHDRLATGFSPLQCGMRVAPSAWSTIHIAGTVNRVIPPRAADGKNCLLVDDGRQRLINVDGNVLWTRPSAGEMVTSGDLRQDGGSYALFTAGSQLLLCDLRSGATIWQTSFEPAYITLKVQVADILPKTPGLEAAVLFTHGDEACLLSLPPHSQPVTLWQRKVVDGDFNERYDHHSGTFVLDLSIPDEPVIWNVRRHRCRGIDARTGNVLNAISYQVGGAERRNYGPCYLGRGSDGALYACVFGEFVQEHVHAIRLQRDAGATLAWQHYYGEVYQDSPGVMLVSHGVVDYDGDGGDEMIYSVRDPAQGLRSFVRFRDVATGNIKFELSDHWGAGLFHDVGADHASGLLALPAPGGATPTRGQLGVYLFEHNRQPLRIHSFPNADCSDGPTVRWNDTNHLLIHTNNAAGQESLLRSTIADRKLVVVEESAVPKLASAPVLATIDGTSGEDLLVTSHDGVLDALDWSGTSAWQQPLEGGAPSLLSAADLDDDRRAELIAATPDNMLRIYSFSNDGQPRERAAFRQAPAGSTAHPLLCDVDNSGTLRLITTGTDAHGRLIIRALDHTGRIAWQTPLEVAATSVQRIVFNAGNFLGPRHVGIAVSITDGRYVREGTYLLDGRTGSVLWFKGLYRNGPSAFPYRPNGIPTAYDFDADGAEDIGIDMMSYMAYLNGKDGEFVFIHPSRNIQMNDGLYAGHLYNTFCPVFRGSQDPRPHWFVTAGFGPFGMMKPDPRAGLWREDLDYDVPANIALVDVDGDRTLEAGYAALNDNTFVCRDAWTGAIEWKLPLPYPPNSITLTADFDGDGKGEFLCGAFCIGVNSQGQGTLRWQLPQSVASPLVADFDGDGIGEIAGSIASKLLVFKAAVTKP